MRYTPLLCLLLSSCSSIWVNASVPLPELQPIQPPSQGAVRNGVGTAVKQAKLTQPVEISAPRKTDHGEGRYYVCLRQTNPSADQPRFMFSVFFDNEDYKGSRLSVILEDCEHQQYFLLDIVAPGTTKPSN